MSSRSGEACCELLYSVYLYLTFTVTAILLLAAETGQQQHHLIVQPVLFIRDQTPRLCSAQQEIPERLEAHTTAAINEKHSAPCQCSPDILSNHTYTTNYYISFMKYSVRTPQLRTTVINTPRKDTRQGRQTSK